MVPTVRPDLEAPKVTQARSESQASRGVLSIQPASSMGIGGANGGWRLVLGASEPCVLVETGRVHTHDVYERLVKRAVKYSIESLYLIMLAISPANRGGVTCAVDGS